MTQISFAFSCLSRFTTKSMLNFGREESRTENITAVMISSFLPLPSYQRCKIAVN